MREAHVFCPHDLVDPVELERYLPNGIRPNPDCAGDDHCYLLPDEMTEVFEDLAVRFGCRIEWHDE